MGRVVNDWSLDTYVSSFSDTESYTSGQYTWVTNGSRVGFIQMNSPVPIGATILSAKLRLESTTTQASAFIELTRCRKRTAYSYLSWKNEPGGVGNSGVVVSQTSGATVWEFDVADQLQVISNGGNWYGWRLEATNPSGNVRFYSQESGRGPTLEVEWSDAPDPPSSLSPSGGRSVSKTKPTLTFDVVDVAGNTTLSAVQVQINGTQSMSSPAFDSGRVLTSTPQLNLASTSYAGAVQGTEQFWRARAQDGAGLWSDWSEVTSFNYEGKGTLEVITPSVTGLTISDNTPLVAWALSGRTQAAYQVIVTWVKQPTKWLWTSGKITSTATSLTIPKKVITRDDRTYRITVRVWDTIDRVRTPGDLQRYQVQRDVTFDDDMSVPPVDSLSVEAIGGGPVVELVATRATTPDRWMITRDYDIIGSFTGLDLWAGGTTYKFTDLTAPGMHEARYRFHAVENNERSWGNPVSAVMPESRFAWLLSTDGEMAVPLANVELSWDVEPQQEIMTPLGARRPVIVRQSLGPRTGTVSATIASDLPGSYGVTTLEHKEMLRRMDAALEPVRLAVGDENVPVVIHSLNLDTLKWDVSGTLSFEFFQDGEYPEEV